MTKKGGKYKLNIDSHIRTCRNIHVFNIQYVSLSLVNYIAQLIILNSALAFNYKSLANYYEYFTREREKYRVSKFKVSWITAHGFIIRYLRYIFSNFFILQLRFFCLLVSD